MSIPPVNELNELYKNAPPLACTILSKGPSLDHWLSRMIGDLAVHEGDMRHHGLFLAINEAICWAPPWSYWVFYDSAFRKRVYRKDCVPIYKAGQAAKVEGGYAWCWTRDIEKTSAWNSASAVAFSVLGAWVTAWNEANNENRIVWVRAVGFDGWDSPTGNTWANVIDRRTSVNQNQVHNYTKVNEAIGACLEHYNGVMNVKWYHREIMIPPKGWEIDDGNANPETVGAGTVQADATHAGHDHGQGRVARSVDCRP